MNNVILITVDVEDWFQVENFKPYISFSNWDSYELRIEKNTLRLLDLFDSKSAGNGSKIRVTFFILGWLAKRLPSLVRQIHERGHEVASHGYYHNLCTNESYKTLADDLIKSKKLLEDIIGARVTGYRAPSFSINNEILKIIKECGYIYDSSLNNFELNKRYGKIGPGYKKTRGLIQIDNNFWELPVSNFKMGTKTIPMGGGGYFRLIPFCLFRQGVKAILNKEHAYVFYMHPWEIDPGQPRVREASILSKFRHYINLDKTYKRLACFFKSFPDTQFVTCYQHIKLLKQKVFIKL